MKKTLGDYLIIIFSIIASIATLLGFYQTYYQDLNEQGKWGVIFLGIIALWFLFYNIYIVQKYRKKVGYCEMFEELNIGFTTLHSLDRDDNELNAKEIRNKLKTLCTNIANAFKEVKGHQIGVCIKVIAFGKEGRAKVITLCRDEKSTQNRPIGKNDKPEHWISENSDFNFIYENIADDGSKGFYINNNLPFSYDYSNTRLNGHKKWPPPKFPLLSWLLRLVFWPLKYRSTIVVPIIPLGIDGRTKDKLRGFLCIDSPRHFTFNEQYDVEILKGISDGLYNKIDKFQTKLTDEK